MLDHFGAKTTTLLRKNNFFAGKNFDDLEKYYKPKHTHTHTCIYIYIYMWRLRK